MSPDGTGSCDAFVILSMLQGPRSRATQTSGTASASSVSIRVRASSQTGDPL